MTTENIDTHVTTPTLTPERRRRPAPPLQEEPESQEPIRVRMKRSQYVGFGCIDIYNRIREEDDGFGYTHDHPARTVWRDEVVEEVVPDLLPGQSAALRTVEVFVDGELVQLFPVVDHEAAEAAEMKAKDKRHSFSRKEAEKRASLMVKQGIAEYVR